ncbi:hypothetical protein [Liquorilactobacillus mali]|uniref:hypothetical protein n=1 Tax=Liquorilactobacillus mali TaxID=1618 RepID=UPI0023500159|nr:hypothetical protein [Liquorilactobacillus mali]MDC7953213.1 hypothetical protein [Liquorilactobacillus mali]
MPNWIEGDLRVKGTKKELFNFLRNAIAAQNVVWSKDDDGPIVELSMPIEKYDEYGLRMFEYSVDAYLKGTRRFFIGKSYSKNISFNCDYLVDSEENEEPLVINLDFSAAWNFDDNELSEICKEYHVDMAIYGVESGMQFIHQSTIRNDGEVIESVFKHYQNTADFMFEVPFSNLGG